MLFRKLITVALFVSALSSAFVAQPANAQSAATVTCTDPSYASAWNTWAAQIGASDNTPSSAGAVLISTMKTRYQYEDTVPPTGCEAVRTLIVQYLSTGEDIYYAKQATLSDASNKASYDEIVTSSSARTTTIYKALTAAYPPIAATSSTTPVAPATSTATATDAGTAAAIAPCPDDAFATQLKNDLNTIFSSTTSNLVALIKLRYKYEDLTPPSGCEAARTLIIQNLALTEDFGILMLWSKADSGNASTYTDFMSGAIKTRESVLYPALTAALPAMVATPQATAGS